VNHTRLHASVIIRPPAASVAAKQPDNGFSGHAPHHLDTRRRSIIAGEVDCTASTPYKIDQPASNLNSYSATRRFARIGTAPTYGQENRGLD